MCRCEDRNEIFSIGARSLDGFLAHLRERDKFGDLALYQCETCEQYWAIVRDESSPFIIKVAGAIELNRLDVDAERNRLLVDEG